MVSQFHIIVWRGGGGASQAERDLLTLTYYLVAEYAIVGFKDARIMNKYSIYTERWMPNRFNVIKINVSFFISVFIKSRT